MPSNDAAVEDEKNSDVIYSILNGSPFKIRPDEEKLAILKKGRPLYSLNIVKRDTTRDCDKTFHLSWYSIHRWLCGSKSYNKLFCWPCLLMRPETSSWCSIGNDGMKRFTSLATKHERSKSHLKAISEYDETLNGFGLPPEFVEQLQFKCKEEEGSLSDKTEADDDSVNMTFEDFEKKRNAPGASLGCKIKPNATEPDEGLNISKNITFKAWQEMCKDNFPVSKSRVIENLKLYKWKRKIAKQELKNSRLTGEKLKYEIEALKAKIDYFKALKQDIGAGNEPSTSPNPTLPEITQ